MSSTSSCSELDFIATSSSRSYEPFPSPTFSSEVIRIFVGPSRVIFTAHKATLVKLPYFDKCLNGQFAEASTQTIELPEDSPYAIGQILEYLYSGSVSPSQEELDADLNQNSTTELTGRLVLTYAAAHKFCLEDLENKLMDKMALLARTLAFPVSLLDAYDREPALCFAEDTMLRRFLCMQIAYDLKAFGWDECENSAVPIEEWVSRGGSAVCAVFRLLTSKDPETIHNPSAIELNSCKWHRHSETKPCG